MVSRLGLEPRALALKGEQGSSLNTTHSNNPLTYRPPSSPRLGPFWGLPAPVHGQNTDTQAWAELVCPVPNSRVLTGLEGDTGCGNYHSSVAMLCLLRKNIPSLIERGISKPTEEYENEIGSAPLCMDTLDEHRGKTLFSDASI